MYITEKGELNLPKLLTHIACGFAFLILLKICWPFYQVPTGYRGVVTQFGEIKHIEQEGLVVLPPWKKLWTFNVRAETADIADAEGSTSDQQPVKVSLTVRYSISPNKVSEVFEKYSKDGDLSSYVQTASMEVFKSVTAKYTAPDLIAKRTAVSADIYSALQKKLDLYGANVVNIDMRNFAFGDAYMKAINAKVEQEQLKLVADNKLLTVTSEQRQKVVVAQAERDAAKARADGQAYANLTIAEASAKSMQIQNEALAKNKDVLELRRIEVELTKAQKWNGALPVNMYGSAPIPYIQAPLPQ